MAITFKKHCLKCGNNNTKKFGKRNNRQRYFCHDCKITLANRNKTNSLLSQISWFKKWIIGRLTLEEISHQRNLTIKTVRIKFEHYLNNPPIPKVKPNSNCHLLIDGTYYTDFCILNYLVSV